MIFIVFLLFMAAATNAEPWHGSFYCTSIAKNLDCSTYAKDEQCGTDGITYKNLCTFSKAHCSNDSLHISHAGACTGIIGGEHKKGKEVLTVLFCRELAQMPCPTGIQDEVCASNGVTYPTMCEFAKAKCMHADLLLLSTHACH